MRLPARPSLRGPCTPSRASLTVRFCCARARRCVCVCVCALVLSHIVRSDLSVREPNAFGYLPFYYLEFVLDAFGPLVGAAWPKFSFLGACEPGMPHEHERQRDGRLTRCAPVLIEYVAFVAAHAHDARIANPEMRDMLLRHLDTHMVAPLHESSCLLC